MIISLGCHQSAVLITVIAVFVQVVSSLNSTSGDGTSQQYRLYNRLCSTRRKRKRRGGGDEEEAHGGERGTATEPGKMINYNSSHLSTTANPVVYKNKLDKPVLSTPAQDTTNSSKFGYGDNTAVEQVITKRSDKDHYLFSTSDPLTDPATDVNGSVIHYLSCYCVTLGTLPARTRADHLHCLTGCCRGRRDGAVLEHLWRWVAGSVQCVHCS